MTNFAHLKTLFYTCNSFWSVNRQKDKIRFLLKTELNLKVCQVRVLPTETKTCLRLIQAPKMPLLQSKRIESCFRIQIQCCLQPWQTNRNLFLSPNSADTRFIRLLVVFPGIATVRWPFFPTKNITTRLWKIGSLWRSFTLGLNIIVKLRRKEKTTGLCGVEEDVSMRNQTASSL